MKAKKATDSTLSLLSGARTVSSSSGPLGDLPPLPDSANNTPIVLQAGQGPNLPPSAREDGRITGTDPS